MIEAPPASPVRSDQTERVIRPRRGLPNGRAVVGGFLVMLAAVGTFAAYTSATAAPTTSYAVAARDLQPGDRVEAGAVRLVPLHLPDDQRRRAFDLLEPLIGTTVVEPLLAGELLQEGSVVATGSVAPSRTVSFPVDPARALAGRISPGERVDLVATFGTGPESCTVLVAGDLQVVGVSRDSGSLGAAGGLTASVVVADAAEEVAVAHAVNAGAVTLVRTTGASAGSPAGPRPTQRVCTADAAGDP